MSNYRPRRPSIGSTIAEFVALAARTRPAADAIVTLADAAPRGDARPVLVIPPVLRSDTQTDAFRAFLDQIGYRVFGWGLGVNYGPTPALMAKAAERLDGINAAHGPVTLVGFSMGGLFARWLAQRAPSRVRELITVGSPFRAAPSSSFLPAAVMRNAWKGADIGALASEIERRPAVPSTCLYTRRDGIAAWESCIDPAAPDDNVEVTCRHVEMPVDPDVFRAVAKRLARHATATACGGRLG